MYYAEDEQFAKQLQYEFFATQNLEVDKSSTEKNPIDFKLEFLDPTPSIHDLFVKFNNKFFWGSLGMVQVLWSNRMTTCAGICYFERKGGHCKISLSARLLSLRPRKDLVETLLHEMIHAYLFVTNSYRDRDDHGPEFHKHMWRINKEAGTNITVYHSFHDEVAYYQRHIWRCTGPCQKQKPYYGIVRRAMNRAPGPNDFWWNRHKMECNGTFVKISGPEPPEKRKSKVDGNVKSNDIRNYFNNENNMSTKETSKVMTLKDVVSGKPTGGLKRNGSTLVVTKNDKNEGAVKRVKTDSSSKATKKNGKSVNLNLEKNEVDDDEKAIREKVRNVWCNKFSQNSEDASAKKVKAECLCSKCLCSFSQEEMESHRKICVPETEADLVKREDSEVHCPVCGENVVQFEMNEHLESCLNCTFVNERGIGKEDEEDDEIICQSFPCPCCYKWFLESTMNSHLDECLTLTALKEGIV